MNIEKPSRKTVAYWLNRAVCDLIQTEKLSTVKMHLDWAMKDLEALMGEKNP